jgi:low affinity Fe/Cu permease
MGTVTAQSHRSRDAARPESDPSAARHSEKPLGWFTAFAQRAAQLAGRPATFIIAVAVIVVWGVTGPIFGYSDTWQLLINTGTTIVTFLMVFLIQHTQNRDTLALQVKLDELIIAMQGARNKVAAAEDLCDADLEALHETFRERAGKTLDRLTRRRAEREHP